jgi:hypothetical protein
VERRSSQEESSRSGQAEPIRSIRENIESRRRNTETEAVGYWEVRM